MNRLENLVGAFSLTVADRLVDQTKTMDCPRPTRRRL